MSSTISNATSGLLASQTRLYAAANNIANANSKNYKALNVNNTTDTNGTVAAQVTQSDSDVSLDDQLVQAQQAVNDFKANATVLKVQQQVQGKLLDILA